MPMLSVLVHNGGRPSISLDMFDDVRVLVAFQVSALVCLMGSAGVAIANVIAACLHDLSNVVMLAALTCPRMAAAPAVGHVRS